MYQRDYMMRLIHQLTEMVTSRIAKLSQIGRHTEALAAIHEWYIRLQLPPVKLLNSMSGPAIIEMLSENGRPDLQRIHATARLQQAEGNVWAAQGLEDEAYHKRLKAASLYLFVDQEDGLNEDETIHALQETLRDYVWPLDLSMQWATYYERRGQYATAEDIWFRALDEYGDEAELLHAAIGFYERLLDCSSEQLIRGNLPRAEVEEALADVRMRVAPPTRDEIEQH